jgi:hypothetical protein
MCSTMTWDGTPSVLINLIRPQCVVVVPDWPGEWTLWQNQPELHQLKCADPFSEGIKGSTALQTV